MSVDRQERSWVVARGRIAALVVGILVYPSTAIGADDAPDNAHGRTTSADALPVKRTEIIAVPNVGGNSDIGVEVGVAGSVIRFREGFYPYRYRVDAVAASSFKDDLRGFRLVQQYHVARIDIPQLIWPRLRLDTRTNFTRQVNATWFGVGNATSVQALPPPPDAASAYDYIEEHVRLRALLRIKTDTPFEVALGINVRYELPTAYVTSKLSNDLASGAVRGSKAAFLETLAAGFIVDTRDSEFMPRRGVFYQVGAAGTVGSAEDVRYGEASAVLAHFAPLGGPFFFASRMVGSFLFGTVPFYELQQGGVFNPQYLVGGSRGLRGVRLGRYAGKVKALANTELRVAPLPRFRVLRWSVLPGATAFFDAGRVWSDYEVRAEDGRKLDLKYSAGGGIFFQWDEASVFRVDAAYSPLKERDGDFPVSFYFESGFLF